MSKARLETNFERHTPTASPVKAVMVTPPKLGLEAFFFYKKKSSTKGLSPNGKNFINLNKFEGEHHIRVRDKSGRIFTEDSPIKSPHKENIEYKETKLALRLANLKKRTDMDYKYCAQHGEISSSHYEATQDRIKKCIILFKECYKFSSDKKIFIEKYKKQMQETCLYDPFRLDEIYAPETFHVDAYLAACQKIDYKSSITMEDFEGKPTQGMKRSREEDSSACGVTSLKFFMPRSVKMKIKENQSPATGSIPKYPADKEPSVTKRQLKF